MLVIFKEVLVYELIKERSLLLRFLSIIPRSRPFFGENTFRCRYIASQFIKEMLDINSMICGALTFINGLQLCIFILLWLFVSSALFPTHCLHVSSKAWCNSETTQTHNQILRYMRQVDEELEKLLFWHTSCMVIFESNI